MLGKPCLAYAVDAGQLRPTYQKRVRREASLTDLIVARSRGAADRLQDWGVTAPIEVTADNAFNFHPRPSDENLLRRLWPDADSGVVGIAAVNFQRGPGAAQDQEAYTPFVAQRERYIISRYVDLSATSSTAPGAIPCTTHWAA